LAAAPLSYSFLDGGQLRMTPVQSAVRAIRHVLQEHGDEGTRIGGPANPEAIRWFGQLLGWVWPGSYVEVLSHHDGVVVQDAIVLRFLDSIERFLIFRAAWHRPDGFWPVADDGCGNYFALALGRRDTGGECPVVFFEVMANVQEPAYTVAENYTRFLRDYMRRQCERLGCSELSA
jgi:hypothetical protein